jgi:hypothetical protein
MKISKKKLIQLIKEMAKDIISEQAPVETPVKTPTKTPTKTPSREKDPFKIDPKIKEKPKPKAEKEAPVETPTKTPTKTPSREKDPFKIDPKIKEKPKPKAEAETKGIKEDFINKFSRMLSAVYEANRMKRMISESIVSEDMPMDIEPTRLGPPDPSIKSGIERTSDDFKSPFDAIEIFRKGRADLTTLEKLGSEEYNEIVQDVIEHGIMTGPQIMNAFNLIMTLESPHAEQLEALAKEAVKNRLGVPQHLMDKIEAKLVRPAQQVEPPSDDDDTPEEELLDNFTDEEQALIKKHVDKRVIENALMMGAGYKAHNVLRDIKPQLDAIDERLYPMYMEMMPNVEIFMWKTPLDFPIEGRMPLGKAELKCEDGKCTGAKAEAKLFMVLLHEVAKAAMEMIFAYGLPAHLEPHVYKAVMKKADSYEQEHWMKLIGPRLWKYLNDVIDYIVQERDRDYSIISYLLRKLGMLEPEEFLSIMDDVLHDGQKAVDRLKAILDEVEEDVENYKEAENELPEPEEIMPGDDNEDEIAKLMKATEDELLTKRPEDVPAPQQRRRLEDMEIDELNNELQRAIDSENYKRAAKIRDIIRGR